MSDWKLPRRRRRWEARLRGMPYRSSVSDQPHYVKMYFITQFLPDSTREAVYPMRALQLAAVEIQRLARGRGLRQRFKNIDWDSMSRKERLIKATELSRPPYIEQPTPKAIPNSMLSKYLHFVKSRESARIELPSFASGGFAVWCAARIQSWWRMLKQRWHFTLLRFRMYHIASQQIQFLVKSYLYFDSPEVDPSRPTSKQHQRTYEKLPKFTNTRDEAAYIIQSLWWRHANQRVYKYFRDLIQFRLCGNPASLLRTINPREASLFDKATGIHVRFRLGGHSFPPTLYYKVFLLNPLCDVGSFAPRDYAYASKKAIVTNKYQNNTLTAKLYESSDVADRYRRTNTSFMGRVSSSSNSSSNSSCTIFAPSPLSQSEEKIYNVSQRSGNKNKVVSLKFPPASSPCDSQNTGNRSFTRDVRSNYYTTSQNNRANSNGVRTSDVKYEETKSTLGQIRVGTSYFGTTMSNLGSEGTNNWYKRVENNGWRPVTGSKAQEAAGEEAPQAPRGAYREDNSSNLAFHYSRVKRKEEKEKQRKQKKREWLLHMYKEGLAKEKPVMNQEQDDAEEFKNDQFEEDAKSSDSYYFGDGSKHSGESRNGSSIGGREVSQRGRRGRESFKNTNKSRPSNDYNNFYNGKNTNRNAEVDNNISEYVFSAHDGSGGGGVIVDEGFDLLGDEDLLTWSKNLDYDEYVANWHTLATSGTSGHNYHVPTNQKNARDIVPEPDWVSLKKQFES